MTEYHSLLKRQLRRIYTDNKPVPDDVRELLGLIDDAYRQFDEDRHMLERSLELSSQELLHANSDVRSALESLLDIYFRIDHSGMILAFRQGPNEHLFDHAVDFTGTRIHDIPVKKLGLLFGHAVAEVVRTNSTFRFEVDIRVAGENCFYQAWLIHIHNRQINVMMRNISDIRRAMVKEKTLQMRLARSERMESLGLLAGGVAHDLNNILSPLVAYPELILESLGPNNSARRMIIQIQNSAIRASAIIRDLLTLARRGSFNPELVQINQVIQTYTQSADFISLRNRHPDIEFSTSLAADCAHVNTGTHHISQTVMNLVTNAFEAIIGAGRVVVGTEMISVEKPFGRYDTVAAGNYVRLRVSDSGEGMTPEDLEHIFEPFYTRKKMGYSGSGLGLTVVYGTVKDANGYIDIQSEKGRGTTFDLYFPASDIVPERRREQSLDNLKGKGRILVVDDIPQQRELATYLLQHFGYDVESAADHDEAVKLAEEKSFDLAILDMILENSKDGLDTFTSLRKINPAQRCIIISGFAESDRVEQAMKLGALAFLSKPYTMEALGRLVKETIAVERTQ